ncbi:MAG: mrp-like protein [Rhodospirillaceae bacterium]|nr:MAG: mrp-like protein [Rhodospirillaceae bacterium]
MNRDDERDSVQEDPVNDTGGETTEFSSGLPALSLSQDGQMTLGHLLVQMGKLNPAQVEQVLRWQVLHDCTFGEATVILGLVRQADIMTALARQYHYPILRENSSFTNLSDELVIGHDPFGAAAEAIRSIRSAFVQTCLSRGTRSVMVIGARRGDGCTYLAANLALALAQMVVPTVLVDSDMRGGRLAEVFNVPRRSRGLSEVLRQQTDEQTVMIENIVPSLSLLPVGGLAAQSAGTFVVGGIHRPDLAAGKTVRRRDL